MKIAKETKENIKGLANDLISLILITVVCTGMFYAIYSCNTLREVMNKNNAVYVNSLNSMQEQISVLTEQNRVLAEHIQDIDKTLSEPKLATSQVPLKSNSSAKTYMSLNAITDTSSRQYNFIRSSRCDIDDKGFIVVDEEYIGVALGSYFGEIGSKYVFTLEGGKELKVCKVEAKADRDTCNDNYMARDGHVIEFVVDTHTEFMESNIKANGYIFNGNFNNYPELSGSIVNVEKVIEG